MNKNLQSIVVTGASGLVGRNFLAYAKSYYNIYAIARRSQKEVGVEVHPNILWMHCDITNKTHLDNILKMVRKKGFISFILHIAAYYDFIDPYNKIYYTTNVDGTKNLLECAKIVKPGRFIFVSSTAASNFTTGNESLNEDSPLDGVCDYAMCKRVGEKMLKEYSEYFPCTSIRPAAVFTDWCEYPPLYILLNTWLTSSWKSKILAGKGETAIPYIHVHDLNLLFHQIMLKSSNLTNFCIFIASPDGCTSHRELFEISSRYFFGKSIKPVYLPKIVAAMGIKLRYMAGKIIGKIPFEKPWMIDFIDKKLIINSSWTRRELMWKPTSRYQISRRLLIMVENMKIMPNKWHYKNKNAMLRKEKRNNLEIYYALYEQKDRIVSEIETKLLDPSRKDNFYHYQKINRKNLNWIISTFCEIIMATIKNNDRSIFINYIKNLVNFKRSESFDLVEVILAINEIGSTIIKNLMKIRSCYNIKQEIYDNIGMTIQLITDEIEDFYEEMAPAGFSTETQSKNTSINSLFKP